MNSEIVIELKLVRHILGENRYIKLAKEADL
jgi:hypothetical protein